MSIQLGPHIGLVGCGRWGRIILRDLLALGCRVSVAEHSAEGREHAIAAGAIDVVDDLSGLPVDVAGFVIATQTERHADTIDRLLESGRPIFVEKPLTSDLASSERIAETASDRVFVMEKWRYHPGVEALADIAKSGELGAIQMVTTRRLQWGYNHTDVDPLWILLPHDLSILDELMGGLPAPQWAAVERCGDTVTGLIGAFDNARVEVSVRRARYDRTLEVICEHGNATLISPYDDHVLVTRDDGLTGFHDPVPEKRPISTEFPLVRELRAFRNYLQGEPPPKCDAAAGARTVRTLSELRRLAGL